MSGPGHAQAVAHHPLPANDADDPFERRRRADTDADADTSVRVSGEREVASANPDADHLRAALLAAHQALADAHQAVDARDAELLLQSQRIGALTNAIAQLEHGNAIAERHLTSLEQERDEARAEIERMDRALKRATRVLESTRELVHVARHDVEVERGRHIAAAAALVTEHRKAIVALDQRHQRELAEAEQRAVAALATQYLVLAAFWRR